MRTEAAVTTGRGAPLAVVAIELDDPRPDEVIVEIAAAGICHTDLGMSAVVPPGTVLGHEGAGTVVAVGAAVSKVAPGDRVGLTFGSCGGCRNCRSRAPSYCYRIEPLNFHFARADGTKTARLADGKPAHAAFFQQSSWARHALATERNVVKLPDALSFEKAAPLGCGIQTGFGGVINALKPPAGSSLAIFGVGAVGLSAIMGAKAAGCAPIIAVDVNEARLALALEVGATHAVRGGPDALAALRAICPDGVDNSLECAGVIETYTQAIECLVPLGTCGLIGVPNEGQPFMTGTPATLMLGRRAMGILEGSSIPDETIPDLARRHLAGALPYDRFIRTYPFAQINEAVADMAAGRAIKPVLLMG